MLIINGLNAGYGHLTVLKGIDMTVKPGEFVAIIGPNGAGKSTVLKSIFSLCEMTSGSITFEKKDISALKTHELIKRGICYVPQGRQVFGDLTVEENLMMGAYTIKDQQTVKKRLTAVYKRFPKLQARKDYRAYTFSGGERQILALARALMHQPKLLLLDEPSLGLSPKAVKDIFKLIDGISHDGVGILMVEQNAKAAVSIADKTYVLEDGKVRLVGGKELLQDERLAKVYFGGD